MNKMRVSARALVRRRIVVTLAHPISLFSSNFHNVANEGKLEIDFNRIRNVYGAISLFREMMKIRPQPSVFQITKLLNVVVKMKQYTVALSMFDEMRQRGISVDDYTFSIAMNCYCTLNRVGYGFAILCSYFKHGYEPNVAIFTTLIKGLFADGRAVEAEMLFRRMLLHNLCVPNEVMISTLTNGLCKSGNTRAACYYLMQSPKMGYNANVYAYSTVIDSLCKGRMVDLALELFRLMINRGVSPNAVTYTSMIHGLCCAGRWEGMLRLLHEMMDQKMSLKVVTFNVFVNLLCKKGMVKEAEDLVEIMMIQNVSPDIYTYNGLIDGYCLQGKMDIAKDLIDSLLFVGSLATEGLKPNIFSYGSLINGYCKNRRVDEAWRVFLEVPRQGLQHTTCTYNTMIQGLLSENRFDDAWKLFNDMKAHQLRPDLFTYNIVMDGLRKAHRLHREIEKSRNELDGGLYNELYKAIPILKKMSQRGFSAHSFICSFISA